MTMEKLGDGLSDEHTRGSDAAGQAQDSSWGSFTTTPVPDAGSSDIELEHSATSSAGQHVLTAIVKVARAGYVPEGLEVRARVSPELFTAALDPADLPRIVSDPEVIAVEPAWSLHAPEETPPDAP